MSDQRPSLDSDWFPGSIPDNIAFGPNAYVDTSYSFSAFCSRRQPGLVLGEAAGLYMRASVIAGSRARIVIGDYTCVNGAYLICSERLTIGNHCLLAWGAVLTDTWPETGESVSARRAARLRDAAAQRSRPYPTCAKPKPVTVHDNVWVGFDAVVLPGVELGRGCIVGCKSVIAQDVPPYAVVAGNPARVIHRLVPDDSAEARQRVLKENIRGQSQ